MDKTDVITTDDLKTKQPPAKTDDQKPEKLVEVDGRIIPDSHLPTEFAEGVLDIASDGHGFLRPQFTPSPKDVYISASQVRRFQFREGDFIGGQVRAPKDSERYRSILKIEKFNGEPIEKMRPRPWFNQLTPIFPQPQIKLETEQKLLAPRVVDLIAPIGFGQRGLIVSPPKAGKTWLMKDIAYGVAKNYPNIHLMAVLIGERPEEVTDLVRSIKGEVISSNFDEPPDYQTRAAEIAIERAKRLVESGKDVFILLDSITRLARAYNLSIPSSGRTLSGGFDPTALYPAKRFFGAARNIEKGGSLTIIGTTLVDTGSKMDDLIYEEFKGTGNMEIHLERRLAERRIFPAIDIQKSGTRKEELLFDAKIYPQVVRMRRMVDLLNKDERTEAFLNKLAKTKNNQEFLSTLNHG